MKIDSVDAQAARIEVLQHRRIQIGKTRALEVLGSQGYDVSRFEKVPQQAGAAFAVPSTP